MRPLPAKRVAREVFVDVESDIDSDCMETSLDQSMSQSVLNESLGTRGESYWKDRCLKAEEALRVLRAEHKTEIEELKAKHEADIAASRDLFLVRTKPSRANGSGQARSFGKELKAIAIDASADGVASKDIQKVLKSMKRFIDVDSDDGGLRKVPEADYFNKFRSGEMARLANKQREQWIADAEMIALSVDGTTMNGDHHICIGGFNERTEYHCLSIKKISASTGLEIAGTMLEMIRQIPGLIPGLLERLQESRLGKGKQSLSRTGRSWVVSR